MSILDTFFLDTGQTWFRKSLRTTAIPVCTHVFATENVYLLSHFNLHAGPCWSDFLHSCLLFLLHHSPLKQVAMPDSVWCKMGLVFSLEKPSALKVRKNYPQEESFPPFSNLLILMETKWDSFCLSPNWLLMLPTDLVKMDQSFPFLSMVLFFGNRVKYVFYIWFFFASHTVLRLIHVVVHINNSVVFIAEKYFIV